MTTREITHSEVFTANADVLFTMLITPSSIRGWWGVARAIVIAEEGGIYALTWGDDEDKPDYSSIGDIVTYMPGKTFEISNYRYTALTGKHPFSIKDMVVRFEMLPEGERTKLTVINSGFPTDKIADEFYNGCVQGWKDTFAGIRNFLETS